MSISVRLRYKGYRCELGKSFSKKRPLEITKTVPLMSGWLYIWVVYKNSPLNVWVVMNMGGLQEQSL